MNAADRRQFQKMREDLTEVLARTSRLPVRFGDAGGAGGIGRWFRITGATQNGGNNRWSYTGRKLVKATAGFDGWSDDANDSTSYTLYSANEDQNGATGTYGNGVSQANIDAIGGTVAMQRIPNTTRVFALPVTVDADGSIEWWIPNLPNGVDGECPS